MTTRPPQTQRAMSAPLNALLLARGGALWGVTLAVGVCVGLTVEKLKMQKRVSKQPPATRSSRGAPLPGIKMPANRGMETYVGGLAGTSVYTKESMSSMEMAALGVVSGCGMSLTMIVCATVESRSRFSNPKTLNTIESPGSNEDVLTKTGSASSSCTLASAPRPAG